MDRVAAVAWGFLPMSVLVLTLPVSAVTGWPVQSVGNLVLAGTVAAMTLWAYATPRIAWRWMPMGLALGFLCAVAVSAVFTELLLANVLFQDGLRRVP